MELTLTIENETSLSNGGPLSVKLAKGDSLDIGRNAQLDWPLPDPSRFISGKHCEVRYRDDGFWLYDVSTNGTFLNDESDRMPAPHRLCDGDRIVIGPYVIFVALEGEEPASEEPPKSDFPEPAAPIVITEVAPRASGSAFGLEFERQANVAPPSAAVEPPPEERAVARPVVFRPARRSAPIAAPFEDDSDEPVPVWANVVAAARSAPATPSAPPASPAAESPPAERPATGLDRPESAARDFRPQAPPATPESSPTMPSPESAVPSGTSANSVSRREDAEASRSAAAAIVQETPPAAAAANSEARAPERQPTAGQDQADAVAAAQPRAETPARNETADAEAFIQRFAQGAGIPEQVFARRDPLEVAEELGVLMLLVTENLKQLLSARQETRRFTRAGSQTMIQALDNNPLKFAPTSEDALRIMLGPRSKSYLDARRTLEAAFRDLKTHQIKTFSAMQGAVKMLLEDIDPSEIEAAAGPEEGGLGGWLANRKSRLWDIFLARWQAKTMRHSDGIVDAFMLYFAECYDRADS